MTAEELIEWRKGNRLSQERAAKLLGCSRRGIQKWEKGENKIPRTIALAIAAFQYKLPPYGSPK